MNFSVLAPEINSVRMFAGAGSSPLLATAAEWNGLAGELASAVSCFGSVISGLAGGPWQGAASAAMAAAASPYADWLTAASAAGQAAGQARAVVGVFEAAQAAMVHPILEDFACKIFKLKDLKYVAWAGVIVF